MERYAFIAVLGAALGWLRMRRYLRGNLGLFIGGFVALALAAAYPLWRESRDHQDALAREVSLPVPQRGGGYVSSQNCISCHPSQHASWKATYHRSMTQVASAETVKADFKDVTLHSDGHSYALKQEGDAFYVDVDGQGPTRLGMLTGSHHMQAFWMQGPVGNQQLEFPFTYLLEDKRWVPRSDVFLIDPTFKKVQSVWNSSCIECHATGGEPRLSVAPNGQGTIPQTHVGELGIACDACHGPGYQHVMANQNPARRYVKHLLHEGDDTIVNPAKLDGPRSSQVCGQCHTVSCNLDGWNWRGLDYVPGQDLQKKKPLIFTDLKRNESCNDLIAKDSSFFDSRFWKDGQIRVSGREYNALAGSKCYGGGKLSCVSCHSAHEGDPDGLVTSEMRGNKACLGCHPTLAKNVPAHTHHAENSEGSNCYSCHMGRTTYGLLKGIRNHQIDSPTVQKAVDTGRPTSCNMCHLDRTLEWTNGYLSAWYGQPKAKLAPELVETATGARGTLSGDAGERAIIAWSLGSPEGQHAAGADWQAPYLAQLLLDPYAAIRYIACHSIEKLPGYGDLKLDCSAELAQRALDRDAVLARWKKLQSAPTARTGKELLIGANHEILQASWDALLKKRDDKGMFLAE